MVISGVNTVTYNGDGSQTAWPFTFPIASASEIKVQLINADGTTTAVENDYYVDVVNNTVYYPGYAPGAEPPEADQPPKVQTGQKIEIYREVPMTQEANLGDVWPYFIIEKGLDKLTMIAQQIYSYTNRKLDAALASMFQLAGIVTDSGKLQHITDQYNAIDENSAAAAESEENAAASATAAANSATSAGTSATNAATSYVNANAVATALTDIYNEAIDQGTIVAPAVDATLTITGAAADAKVAGDAIHELNKDVYGKYPDIPVTDKVDNKYMGSTGTITNSNAMCYGFADVTNETTVVVNTTNFSDTVIINMCDSSKGFVRNVVSWGAASKYTISVEAGESYICISSKKVDMPLVAIYHEDIDDGMAFRLETIEDYTVSLADKTAISSSNFDAVNYFNQKHLMNAYINIYDVITGNANNRLAWVKLPADTLFTVDVSKKANTDMRMALYNTVPEAGAAGIESNYGATNNDSFSATFETRNGYVYFAIKYWATSATTYTAQEVLDSIVIRNTNGKVGETIKTKVNNARHIAGETATPLTIVHFSDLHGEYETLRRISAGIQALGDKVQDAICTGDLGGNAAVQIASWWNPKIMTCIGNHDSATYDSGTGYDWTALSMADRDAYYIAPFESNWNIVHTAGTSYYYKDYTTQKVRLIVMDAMLYSSSEADPTLGTTQTAWLENLLADAITNNLHVLIAIHAPHGGATAKECSFSKYGQGAMPTNIDCNTPQTVIDAVQTAINNGLHLVGYLVGHTHQDNIWDAENDGKQLMYCVTCAATIKVQWKDSDQHRSDTEDAYNIVTIDTANTLVKVVRGGGADIDDHMRTRKAICFNYTTGEVVGEIL